MLSKVSDSTLFDHLDTTWEFKRGPTPTTTWLSFDLDFAFKSPLYRQIANLFFDEVSCPLSRTGFSIAPRIKFQKDGQKKTALKWLRLEILESPGIAYKILLSE